MSNEERERLFRHSVIDVASYVARAACGTSDQRADHDELVYWLRWRTLENVWLPSGIDACEGYDAAVRTMALEALKMSDARWLKEAVEGLP